MRALLAKLKMDKHHRIKWLASFSMLLVALLSVSVTIGIKSHKDSKTTLSDTAIYTQQFKTSLTGVSGTVEGIYSNEDNTKVFLLLKFKDVSKISVDANEYQMFLTGSSLDMSPSTLNINPSGSIYMFGSTGYMGIYLSESRGFEKQILSLVVRCNSQITAKEDKTSSEAASDASFDKYDQFQIYFNGGASGTTKLDILESDSDIKVSDMYQAMIAKPEEDEVRELLKSDVDTLRLDLDRIDEYTKRLVTAGIQIPETPEQIRGDFYTVSKDDESIVYMNMASVLPGGVEFNWQDGSVKDGYLDDLVGNMSYTDYFAQLNEASKSSASLDLTGLVWLTSSGEEFSLNNSSDSFVTTRDTSIQNDISGLQQAWRTYYSDKRNYQTKDLRSLLSIEVDVKESDSVFTLNNSKGVLTNWQSK